MLLAIECLCVKFLTFMVEEIDGLTNSFDCTKNVKCVFGEGNLNRSLHSIHFSQKSLLASEGGDSAVNELAVVVSFISIYIFRVEYTSLAIVII